MRITNNMLSRNLLRNLEAAQGRMDELQNQMSTGHRISKPSDDPVGIENALRMKTNIAMVEQWKNNASEGLGYMNTADSTLGDLTSMLQRAKELAIQGANGSLSADDKANVAEEVIQITEQIKLVANTKIGTKFIFGGTANVEPYLTTGDKWVGSDDVVKFAVGNNLSLPISVNGRTLFGVQADDSVGMFATLKKLSDALKNPAGADDIQTAIGELDASTDIVLNKRAELGARVNRMNSLYEQMDSTLLNMKQTLSDVMDADMAKTIVDFKNQENVFRAALSVGAQIIQPSLVDFMR